MQSLNRGFSLRAFQGLERMQRLLVAEKAGRYKLEGDECTQRRGLGSVWEE